MICGYYVRTQELTKLVLAISTPPQTLSLPLKAGKKSFVMLQLVLSPGPEPPLLWKEIMTMYDEHIIQVCIGVCVVDYGYLRITTFGATTITEAAVVINTHESRGKLAYSVGRTGRARINGSCACAVRLHEAR